MLPYMSYREFCIGMYKYILSAKEKNKNQLLEDFRYQHKN